MGHLITQSGRAFQTPGRAFGFLDLQKLGRVFEKLGQVFESHGRIQNIRTVKSSLHVLESNNSFKILIELQL